MLPFHNKKKAHRKITINTEKKTRAWVNLKWSFKDELRTSFFISGNGTIFGYDKSYNNSLGFRGTWSFSYMASYNIQRELFLLVFEFTYFVAIFWRNIYINYQRKSRMEMVSALSLWLSIGKISYYLNFHEIFDSLRNYFF